MPNGQPREKIACPQCGCGHCPVFFTQVYESCFNGIERRSVRRHRKCRFCTWTFITIETYEDSDGAGPGVPLPPDVPVPPVSDAKTGRPKSGDKRSAGPVPRKAAASSRPSDEAGSGNLPVRQKPTPSTKKIKPPRNPYI